MYIGIKDFIKEFKEPFDANASALKKAKERLRERGERATEAAVREEAKIIREEWEELNKKGIKIHKQVQDKKAKIKNCIVEGWAKADKKGTPSSSSNKLENNTNYIEKRVVSEKYGLVGYADDVEVKNNFINIEDTKTVKAIYKTSAIKLKNGMTLPPTYFYAPINKLQDCNFNEAALQMSLYMYILWTHNKKLKPGKMYIRHIKTNSQDKILEEKLHKVPYLRDEVKAMLKHRLQNAL